MKKIFENRRDRGFSKLAEQAERDALIAREIRWLQMAAEAAEMGADLPSRQPEE